MSFTSIDNLVSEMNNGKNWRQHWTKTYSMSDVYLAQTTAAGRWYDLIGYNQCQYMHGNYVYNAHMASGLDGWTLSSANVSWDAANTAASKTGASTETITQNTDCVNGTTYEVIYSIAGHAGSGGVTISLGGTNGTARSGNGTYSDNIVCGATAGAPVTVTINAGVSACRIDNISIRRALSFTPYTGVAIGREAGIWHGGNVSPDTKHLVGMGVWTSAASASSSVIYLIDVLGCYPKIDSGVTSVQLLNNSLTLPRYTDGKGVRAFFTMRDSNGANAQTFSMNYTAPGSVSNQSLGAVVSNTTSGIYGHISHTGVAAGNFGPFLPLGGGGDGIMSVQSAQFSVAGGAGGNVDLVLCKPLAAIQVPQAFIAAERDFLTQMLSLPRIYDDAVLGVIVQAGAVIATNSQWQGYIETAWG